MLEDWSAGVVKMNLRRGRWNINNYSGITAMKERKARDREKQEIKNECKEKK